MARNKNRTVLASALRNRNKKKKKKEDKPKKNKVESAKKAVQKSNSSHITQVSKNTQNKSEPKTQPSTPTTRKGTTQSGRTTARRNATQDIGTSFKKAINLQKAEPYKSNKTNKYEAAIDKAQHTSALGTKVETKTDTYKLYDDDTVAKAKEDTTAQYRAAANEAIEDYVKKGYDRETVARVINEEIDKELQNALNKIDKDSKVEYSYTPMTRQEYGQMEVGSMTGQLQKNLKANKDLNKKVTDLNVKDYVEGAGIMGALDQATQGLSVSQDPTYNYSKGQKQIIEAQKQTGKYKTGRVVGGIAEFALGGTGAMGSSIAKSAFKTTGKSVLKELGEQGGKKLTKEAVKNATKETAGDVIASSGLNILDALKDSYKDGKYDKGTFWKYLVLNTLGDVLIGGTISGITHGLSAKQVKNFNKITDKLKKGEALTEVEQKFYNNKYGKIADEIEAEVKRQQAKQEDIEKGLVKPKTNAEEVVPAKTEVAEPVKAEEPTVKPQESVAPKAEEPTVVKKETVEPTASGVDLKEKQLELIQKKNPAQDDTHTWIRSTDDIKTFDETLNDSDYADYLDEGFAPDYTGKMAQEALKTGKITVYSSHPIEDGVFVSPSKMEAESYAGGGKIYSQEVDLNDVAWVDPTQGQYAKVADNTKLETKAPSPKTQADEVRKAGRTDDEILAEQKQDVDPSKTAEQEVKSLAEKKAYAERRLAEAEARLKEATDPHTRADMEATKGHLETVIARLDSQINESALAPETKASIINDAKLERERLATSYSARKELKPIEKEYKELFFKLRAMESKPVIEDAAKYEKYVARRQELADKIEDLYEKIDTTPKEIDESYMSYLNRRGEMQDILDDIAKTEGRENIATPTREIVEKADDIGNASRGVYNNDIKILDSSNKRMWDNVTRLCVDTFRGFDNFARQLPEEARDVFRAQVNAMRNSNNWSSAWLVNKRVSSEGKELGASLKDILGDLLNPKNKVKYDDFQYYCANMHNIDRFNEGKGVFGNKVTAAESAEICEHLAKNNPDFPDKQKEIVEFLRDLQKERVSAGLVSEDLAKSLDELYKNYIPTYRVKDGKRVRIVGDQSDTIGMANPIKFAKGGDAQLLPLHEQISNQVNYTFKLATQNRLFRLLATTQGIDVKSLPADARLEDVFDACTFTAKETDGATSKYFVAFRDAGELKKVEVSEQMWLGMRDWHKDPGSAGAFFDWKMKPLRGANQLFKNLITSYNPIFGVKNIIRDSAEGLINTKNVRGFIASYPKAVASVLNKNGYGKYFDLYEATGGKYAQLRGDIANMKVEGTFKKVASSPIKFCAWFNDTLEAIPRMAEFISTINKELNADAIFKAGGSVDDVLAKMNNKTLTKAMYNANEVTLNFGRSGVAGKALNSTFVPYLNPAIQGVDKIVRNFQDAGANGVRGFIGLAAKLGAVAVAPALFNEIALHVFGVDSFKDLNTRDKNNNYFIPVGDGKFVKLPKSRVSAAVAAPFEHTLRHLMYGDPMEWKQMFNTAWTNVGVTNPLESNLFSPIMMVMNNKTWYGGNIESAKDLQLREAGKVSEIYDSTTSAVSIWIGDKMNMSPKKVDYIIDAYTGVIGDFLLPMTAEASSGNPLYKNFILDSVFSNKLSTTFWDKNAKLEALAEVNEGEDKKKFEEWKSTYMYDALTLNQAIKDIDADKNLTKKQKLEIKRELRKGLNKFYAAGTNESSINFEPVSFIASKIGTDKALTNYLPDDEDPEYSFKMHYKNYKASVGYDNLSKSEKKQASQDFLKTYKLAVETQSQISPKHHNTPDWTTVAIANVMSNSNPKVAEACGVFPETIEDAKEYVKANGDTRKYIITQKRINKVTEKLASNGVDTDSKTFTKYLDTGVSALALATSSTEFKDRAYFITKSDEQMNAARGITSKYKWKTNEVVDVGLSADYDGNGYLRKDEVVTAIENSKATTNEEKAMLFNLILGSSSNNPYGSIGDYSLKGDTGVSRGGSSYSGSHRGGSGGGKSSSTPSWSEFLSNYLSENSSNQSSTKLTSYKPSTGSAYQKKIKKILDNMEV